MKKLFFIGSGKMATAIAGGLISSGTFSADELGAFDPSSAAAECFQTITGIKHPGYPMRKRFWSQSNRK